MPARGALVDRRPPWFCRGICSNNKETMAVSPTFQTQRHPMSSHIHQRLFANITRRARSRPILPVVLGALYLCHAARLSASPDCPAACNCSLAAARSTEPWWIQPLITGVGIGLGALMIIWQMKRQHRSALELQERQHRDSLKQQDRQFVIETRLEVFREISGVLTAAIWSVVAFESGVLFVSQRLANACIASTDDSVELPPSGDGYLDLTEKFDAQNTAIANLVSIIERYEIIDTNIAIFRTAFASTQYDLQESWIEILPRMHTVLHRRGPRAGVELQPPLITGRDHVKHLSRDLELLSQIACDLSAYLLDCVREMQKVFLGQLFDGEVPVRAPINPQAVVITTDSASVKRLKDYFATQTAWGISHAKSAELVRERYRMP